QTVDTTVIAQDGETVALGGLISKRDEKHENKVPWFGDLPYVGAAFRYRTMAKTKTELLIIMTPHIVRNRAEADMVLADEARRMDWCLADVARIHGLSGMAPILPPPHAGVGGVDGGVAMPFNTPPLVPGVPGVPGGPDTLPPPRVVPPTGPDT